MNDNPRLQMVDHALAYAGREATGVPLHQMIGPGRRQTRRAVDARDGAIAALYDPTTAGQFRGGAKWGISRIARVFEMDTSSVLAALRRAGVWGVE